MPNRIIREGLLDSERYWSVTVDARQLFIHLMLLADDFGLVSLAPVLVRRRCFEDPPSQQKIDKLLEQLHDADLLRIYDHGPENGPARYAFIPRFRQFLRIQKAKCPMPPRELFQDDQHARRLFSENNAQFQQMQRSRTSPVMRLRSEGKGKERESEDKEGNGNGQGNGPPPRKNLQTWAAEKGLHRTAGESEPDFIKRASQAYVRALP